MYSVDQVFQDNERLKEENEVLRQELSQLNMMCQVLTNQVAELDNEKKAEGSPDRGEEGEDEQGNRGPREHLGAGLEEKGDDSEDEDEVSISQSEEYRENVMRLKQEYELLTAMMNIQKQEFDTMEKTIQEKDQEIGRLESTLMETEQRANMLEEGQALLNSASISQQQDIRFLRAENERLQQLLKQSSSEVRTLESSLREKNERVSTLERELAKEKAKDRECVFSSQTEGVELAQLRQTTKKLEKEVRQTRDFCQQEIEKEHKKALTQSGLTEFMRLLGEVLRSGKVEEITDCQLCRMKHDEEHSDCDGYCCLQEVAEMVNECNQKESEVSKKLESKMELQYHSAIQKRELIIVALLSILLIRIFRFF